MYPVAVFANPFGMNDNQVNTGSSGTPLYTAARGKVQGLSNLKQFQVL